MKSRYFWEIAALKKFSIVFETEETVYGRDAQNEFKTFRKDTGQISFSEREILESRLADLKILHKRETENDTENYYCRRWSNRHFAGCEFA